MNKTPIFPYQEASYQTKCGFGGFNAKYQHQYDVLLPYPITKRLLHSSFVDSTYVKNIKEVGRAINRK